MTLRHGVSVRQYYFVVEDLAPRLDPKLDSFTKLDSFDLKDEIRARCGFDNFWCDTLKGYSTGEIKVGGLAKAREVMAFLTNRWWSYHCSDTTNPHEISYPVGCNCAVLPVHLRPDRCSCGNNLNTPPPSPLVGQFQQRSGFIHGAGWNPRFTLLPGSPPLGQTGSLLASPASTTLISGPVRSPPIPPAGPTRHHQHRHSPNQPDNAANNRAPPTPASHKTRSILLGNLNYRVTKEVLEQSFRPAGVIVKCKLPKQRRHPKLNTGTAIVEYASSREAKEAVEMFDGWEFFDRPVQVSLYIRGSERRMLRTTVSSTRPNEQLPTGPLIVDGSHLRP